MSTEFVSSEEGKAEKPPEKEITISLKKEEWFDVLEALGNTDWVDVHEEAAIKIRSELKKKVGDCVDAIF